MENMPQVAEASNNGLEDLLEKHISKLSEKLSRPYTLDEIETELTALNDLVYTFKRRDELLEKLLDGSTAEDKRKQIREALKAQSMRVAENRTEVQRAHAKSHELLQRSTLLLVRAQREINKRAHKHAGYALEVCGLCEGLGGDSDAPCPACKGKGTLLVHQPSIKCPRCNEHGRASAKEQLFYSSELCVVCRGSGWVMTSE
jgi:hypothetical protein